VDYEDDGPVSIISDDDDDVNPMEMDKGKKVLVEPLEKNKRVLTVSSSEVSTDPLNQSKTSEIMSDAFSLVFNPGSDGHDLQNFWSAYRYLQRRPTGVFFEGLSSPNSSSSLLMGSRPRTVHSSRRKPLEVYLDGPHGAPSSGIFAAEHAVLVATGIGVTPFASILQAIMHRYWQSKSTCPQCNFTWSDGGLRTTSGFNLKKVI